MRGNRKISVFFLSLKNEISGEVFKRFSEGDQETILLEIASRTPIAADDRAKVMDEFVVKMQLAGGMVGMAEAEGLLIAAFGSKRAARDMTARLNSVLESQPFSMFRDAEPADIYSFLSTESPQTIALVLSYLVPQKASEILSQFPQSKRNQIAKRIAVMAPMNHESVEEVEAVLKEKYQDQPSTGQSINDGPQILAKVLTTTQREVSDTILESIDATDNETAQKIREYMFTFDDIALIDDQAFRNELMRAVQTDVLGKALKGASEEVRDKFRRNMPERLRGRLDSLMDELGQLRLREVEEAQNSILEEVRRLEEAGKIVISREQEEFVG